MKENGRNRMVNSIAKVIAATILPFILCSCACLVNGTRQQVQINSNPAGADISLNGIPSGKTPNSISLARGETHQVQITKEDYMATSQTIGHRLSGWFWLDLCFYAIPGLVDLGVGSAYNLEPETINAQLQPIAGTEKKLPEESDATRKLLEAKKLLDAGIITNEEFDAIKAKTLPSVLQDTKREEKPEANQGMQPTK